MFIKEHVVIFIQVNIIVVQVPVVMFVPANVVMIRERG